MLYIYNILFNDISNYLENKNITFDTIQLRNSVTCILGEIYSINRKSSIWCLNADVNCKINSVIQNDDKLWLIELITKNIISYDNKSNTPFIFSNKIEENDFKRISISLNGYFNKNIYHSMTEYTYTDYLETGENNVKAVLTLRLKKLNNELRYAATPFVFLPNLTQEEKENLIEKIQNKIKEKNYQYLNSSLIEIENYNDNNSSYELISFIISQTILTDFNKQYHLNNIIEIEKMKSEKDKLQQQLVTLQEEKESLETDILKLEDPDYIAKYVREKYFYSKDGEVILRLE